MRKVLTVRRKLAFSALSLGLFLVGLELALTIAGVQPVTDTRDPFVGFAGAVSLFEESHGPDGSVTMVTRPSKQVWFNPQSFPAEKPPGTRRVFCLGGSTTFGRPYSDSTSFCGWLREFLPVIDSSYQWEVINAGGVSYASYRVAAVMEELAAYEPDLFIIYTGQNEFLEDRTYSDMRNRSGTLLALQGVAAKTRTYALADRLVAFAGPAAGGNLAADGRILLPGEVDERLNHTIGPVDYVRDDEWHAKVVRHFEVNLHRMVQLGRKVGAQVVFISPSSNERDCSPFKSQSMDLEQLGFTVEESRLLQPVFNSPADAPTAESDADVPADLLARAVGLDPRNADLHYRLGRALFAEGDYAQAEVEFGRAMEEDICPLRAVEDLQAALRRVASEEQVPVVDFNGLLKAKSTDEFGHACLGEEYFVDHVHPTIDVHRQLAIWIVEELQGLSFVGGFAVTGQEVAMQIADVERRVILNIDETQHGVALRNLAKVLHWSGKFEEASRRASDALELLRNDPESRFVLADCLKNLGSPAEAQMQYLFLLQDHPDYARAYLPYGELLMIQGEQEAALDYLMMAALNQPNNTYAHLTLGKLCLQMERWQNAVDCLVIADKLYPNHAETESLLKDARQKASEADFVE